MHPSVATMSPVKLPVPDGPVPAGLEFNQASDGSSKACVESSVWHSKSSTPLAFAPILQVVPPISASVPVPAAAADGRHGPIDDLPSGLGG